MGEDRLQAEADQTHRNHCRGVAIRQLRMAATNLHASTLSSEEFEREVATGLSWISNVLEFGSPYANAAADVLEDLVVRMRDHGRRD